MVMSVFLAITTDGVHHYIIAKDFGDAWSKLTKQPTVARTITVLQKLNDNPLLGLEGFLPCP